MKIILYIVLISLVIFIISQIYIVLTSKKSQTQAYKVLVQDDNIEIRFYPSVTTASITSGAKTYNELGNGGFRTLANYIFGGNKTNQQISMTSPVHMEISKDISKMSFVMPAEMNLENLPKPIDSSIHLKNTMSENVASIRFCGFNTEKKIKANTELLKKYLKANSIEYFGNFSVLGYNPPYQFVDRRNEIIVSVRYISNY